LVPQWRELLDIEGKDGRTHHTTGAPPAAGGLPFGPRSSTLSSPNAGIAGVP
jgi:hypothetical protein